ATPAGSDVTFCLRFENVVVDTHVKRLRSTGVACSSTSVPEFWMPPPFTHCDVKPVDCAIGACRMRSVTLRLKPVTLRRRRDLSTVMSKPPSVSVDDSGLIWSAPFTTDAPAFGVPPYNPVGRNVQR